MKSTLILLALAAGLMLYPAPSGAHTLPHRKPFSQMSLREVERYQQRSIAHAQGLIRFWENRRPSAPDRALSAVKPPYEVWWHRRQLGWLRSELARTRAALRRTVGPQGFPPHHALWTCISRYEGSPTSVNPNGHYGMLQMHWNWGYGIVGAASSYSQAAQEWAAERGYAASHYSRSFLYGQWFNYDAAAGPCLQYA